MFSILAVLADPIVSDQLVEHTETVKILGPGVGGFLLLVLGALVIRRKWPKTKTRAQEVGEYHQTLRGATAASHETIRAISADHHETLRRAIVTINRLSGGTSEGSPSKPPTSAPAEPTTHEGES